MDTLPPYLRELDKALLDLPDDCMLLSQLDGFLTGIVVSPDPVPPSIWLNIVWGSDAGGVPSFADMGAFHNFVDLVMRHYNEIVRSLDLPGDYAPLYDVDPNSDETLWEMWVEGFSQALTLKPAGWKRLARSGDPDCVAVLSGLSALAAINEARSRLGDAEVDRWDREAPDLIPQWVETLHAWRLEQDVGMSGKSRTKVGRNEPCPCGSGRKYKKCCGAAAQSI